MRILGETVFVGRAAATQVNLIYLSDETSEGTRSDVDLLSVVGSSGGINIETSENLTD